MDSSKKSKKSSGATCWLSSKAKTARTGIYLLALALAAPVNATAAEGGVVSAVGTGKDSGEAIANLLRTAVNKYFKDEPATLSKAVLQSEMIPNATSFVQSYRLLESAKGTVSLSANVDLDVIRSLLGVTAARLGAEGGAKAVVLVKPAKLPDSVATATPFSLLEAGAKERLSRRGFEPVVVSPEEAQALSAGEDLTSPELLRGLGARSGARLALGIGARKEQYENENSHAKDDRYVLSAVLVDVKTGAVLSRSSTNVNEPRARKDTYVAELQRLLDSESRDLFQDLFVAAGKKIAPAEAQEDFSLVRVQYPSNPLLVTKFRTLLEAAKALKSVQEYSVQRGAFDLAIRPSLKGEALQKIVTGLKSDDIVVALAENIPDGSERQPDLVVKVAPKAPPAGGPSAMDEEDALNANP